MHNRFTFQNIYAGPVALHIARTVIYRCIHAGSGFSLSFTKLIGIPFAAWIRTSGGVLTVCTGASVCKRTRYRIIADIMFTGDCPNQYPFGMKNRYIYYKALFNLDTSLRKN